MKRRAISLLLAAALSAALLVCPAAAASAPWVQVNGQSVTLQNLSGSWNGVQITLRLNKQADAGSFAFDPSLSSIQTHTACTADGNSLTLYVASQTTLGQDGSLPLGTLSGDGFTVQGVSALRMTSMGPTFDDAKTIVYANVSTSGGSGGGYDPNPGGGYNPGSSGSGGSGGFTEDRYPVRAVSGTGGTLQLSATHAARGQTVTVTATPNAGSQLRSLTVTDSAGRTVATASLGGGKWSFVMPASAVTVTADFSLAQYGALPFTDVNQDDWFRDAVAYVYHAGLMSGTGQTQFSPGGTTTRGMIVTILHRYEGSPAAGGSAFQDVAPGAYYALPVAWAAAGGVVNGIEPTRFGPDLAVTREQMAAILYRYAQQKGLDVGGRANLSVYADAGQVSPYAADAMAWAVHTGLITGVNSYTLQPGGSATRAQVAAILTRFCAYAERG